jgi:hypothetical protein
VNVTAALSNLMLENKLDNTQSLKLTIYRTGNISIYGDIIVQYIPLSGKPYEIGALRGVGVYTNIGRRNIEIKLNNATGKILKSGKLKVQYKSNDESKNPSVFAAEELEIE